MDIQIIHNAGDIAEAVAKKPEAVLREVDKALERGAIEVSREARRRAPKFRTELTNSIQIDARTLEYTIRANAGYAAYREQGTGPGGRPPLKEMLDWIRLKRITPADPRMTVRGLAHLLRRSIARKGSQATPFFRPALEAKRDRLTELVEAGAAKGLAAP
jgi:hypothetical protein